MIFADQRNFVQNDLTTYDSCTIPLGCFFLMQIAANLYAFLLRMQLATKRLITALKKLNLDFCSKPSFRNKKHVWQKLLNDSMLISIFVFQENHKLSPKRSCNSWNLKSGRYHQRSYSVVFGNKGNHQNISNK